jgi:hypothetical protein
VPWQRVVHVRAIPAPPDVDIATDEVGQFTHTLRGKNDAAEKENAVNPADRRVLLKPSLVWGVSDGEVTPRQHGPKTQAPSASPSPATCGKGAHQERSQQSQVTFQPMRIFAQTNKPNRPPAHPSALLRMLSTLPAYLPLRCTD